MQIYKIGIGRTYRHIQRYRQILSVLFRHGFGDVVDTLKIEQYLDIGLNIISRKSRDNVEALSRADRIRMAIEELGPTFIKVGQILSTRPDLLPMDLVTELGKLQDSVPPFEFASAKNILEEELKVPLSEIFSEFDETPLASASIGQVHRASLVGGDDVAVKIQRPGIRKTVEVDLEIMLHLATLMEKHFKDMEVHKPTQIVEEFARTLDKEMDYGMEAANLEQFAAQAGDDHCVYVPRVYREASTGKILTMEFIDGIKASQIGELEKEGLDRKEIARRGFDLILKQIFIHGFFHADPHPGNLFILPDNVICFLDFGMMGRIGRISREHFADLLMSIVSRDEEKAVHALLKLTVSEQESNRQSLERDMADLINSYAYRPLKEIDLEKFLQQMLDMMAKHRLTIPADLFLMIKSLSTVEGLGLSLDPEFDAIAQAEPFIRRIYLDRLHPKRIAQDLYESGKDLLYLARDVPGELREILRLARTGKVKIAFEHRGLEPVLSTLDRIVNRLSFSLVLASLVIGSSLIVLSDLPPRWHDIPIIGLAGFLVAVIMGGWLLWTIIKHGKM